MRRLILLFAGIASIWLPGHALRLDAHDWVSPSGVRAPALAHALDVQLRAELREADFATGSRHIDGEWWLATYAFAILGYAQLAEHQPALRPELRVAARHALDQLLRPEVRAFDTRKWGDDMLDCLDEDEHDHVVLGYLGLGLGAARLLDPELPEAALHDRVATALERRFTTTDAALLLSFPGVAFPVDNAAGFATIGLHARATGRPLSPELRARIAHWEATFMSEDGLLVQTAHAHSGRATSPVRGSGTALAAWLMSYTDPPLASRLAEGTRDTLGATVLGLGAVREYRPGTPGRGDIDSGPLVFGLSVSATGFALGAARGIGDDAWAARLWATTRLFGAPGPDGRFLFGGPLGNAILLAALTTPAADTSHSEHS